jgi:uncharacterized oxidoreductase
MRFVLQQRKSSIKVFEFMAPLVDSPFAAHVKSGQKASPHDVITDLISGLEADEYEMHSGLTQKIYEAVLQSNDAALHAVNGAIGGQS